MEYLNSWLKKKSPGQASNSNGGITNGSPGSAFSLGGQNLPTDLNWTTAPSVAGYLQSQPVIPGEFGGGYEGFMANGGGITGPATGASPSIFDKLMDSKGWGGVISGVASAGLGAYNAWMGQQNQDFLHKYYGNQQALQRADFTNNANMTNLKLEDRQNTSLRNQGINPNSDTGKAHIADYMNKWKVQTTV